MRAYAAIISASTVAVEAKQAVSVFGKPARFQIKNNIAASAGKFPVHPAITVDVVHREKARIGFPAAFTFAPEFRDHFKARSLAFLAASLQYHRSVLGIPFTGSLARLSLIFFRLLSEPPAPARGKQFRICFSFGIPPRLLNLLAQFIRSPETCLFTQFVGFCKRTSTAFVLASCGFLCHAQNLDRFASVGNAIGKFGEVSAA